MRALRALLFALVALATAPAFAVLPDEVLPDAAMEARARSLSHELRCLVCQNQSIDDSDSDFARDIRLLLRERLVAGDTDGEVIDYLVARYGQFILLKPQFNATTAILWIAPFLLVIGGAILAVGVLRRRAVRLGEPNTLTDDEKRKLEKALRDSAPGGA